MPDEYYPLRSVDLSVEVEVDLATEDIPEAAKRRLARKALQRIVRDLEGDEFSSHEEGPPLKAHIEPLDVSVNPDNWVRPAGIDMRVVKSAHRVVKEVSKRGESGQAVLASELVQDGLVSAPTMSRLLREDEAGGQYLAPFVQVSDAGRTKALDLTPKGRLLASKIRAGVVPA